MISNTTDLSKAKRALLEKYARGRLAQTTATARVIPRRAEGSVVPLSFGQQQMWLLSQLIPDTPVYNESVTVHLPGLLDVAALERSFYEIIRRHESWRTSFPQLDGQPVQRIHPSLPLSLPLVDLRYLPKLEREVEALRLATEDGRKPFDLAHGPLLRAMLIQLNEMEHRLYLTLHHIIFDGISVYQVFLAELRTLYEAFSTGRPSPLPELPIQYADFAVWQREQLQGDVLEKQLNYWKRQLEDAPAILELPTDRPHLLNPTYCGSMYPVALPKHLTDALRELSRQEECTFYMTLLAAFKTLLFRYTGQDDILVGTATAGRKHSEVQKLLGVFINTLVMRTHLTGDMSFRELLACVREETLEADAHQDVPFEYLVKELQPERGVGQNPFFQVLFMLEPPISVLPSGWTLTHMDVKTDTSKFDLALILEDRPEGIVGFFEYSTDLFDTATINRMVEHWQTLLEGIVANPAQRIAELPLLTGVEQQQLLIEWNATSTSYPKDQCVHQLFEAQVERTPDAVALVYEDQQMTYRELNARANQLAHCLQRLGVEPEVLVGLCMDRSLEMIVGLLGILKAGGAYVPLDPTYPKERLAFMLEDTQAPVLVTQERLIGLLPKQGAHVVCLDREWKEIAQECWENLVNGATAENLAYVMYTSGSTGRPKGVEVRHRSIIRLLFGVDYVFLDATRTVLHMAPISFDAATFEVWGALLHGARCVLFPERIPTPKSIGAVIRKHHITTAWLTASLFNVVIDEAPEMLEGVEQLLTGGEALSVVHIRRALDVLPATQFINGYGPTESTTFTCCYPIPKQLSETTRSISIGRPIGNTQVYILDCYLNPVPIGVPGELHIGGDGLARGYLNHPKLTAEKFIVSPFGDDPSARLYKTGDLARYLRDGTIEFLGRLDDQVKIRGFRIEPGEIGAVLGQHPDVREAVVVVDEDVCGNKRLVAYLVQDAERPTTINEVRRFVKEQLPEYMVPSDFVLLDSLPLTPNGKLDRDALPAPDAVRLPVEETFVAAKSIVHYQLMRIWEDLLDVPLIGIRDNFFYLGGHSLLAARLVNKIEQVCGKKIALATLFAGPTIEQLANALQAEEEERNSRAPIVAVQASGSKRPFFYLHGSWNSEAFHCFHLARHFGSDQPFYALEPYHFDGLQVAPTVEAMAQAHLQSLRAVQPEGPYLLGGFCNGGLIAYEMARQLHVQGQKVDLLVLIDPAYPSALHAVVRSVVSRICGLMRLSQEKPLEWFLRLRHVYKYLRRQRRLQDLKAFRAIDPSIQTLLPTADALRQDNIAIFDWISVGYSYASYPGKVMLFWAREVPFGRVWRQKAAQEKEIEVRIIPGTHIGCLTEHVQALAEELGTCLSEAQAAELKESEYGESITVSVD